jgi:hypothetical protein
MVGRRFIAGTTNTKREISNRIRDRQVAYWTLMQSALKFHLRGTAQGPDPPHFGVLGQGFIPDPLRALCGAVKELYRRQLQPQTKKFEIMYATKSRSILYRMLTSAR